MGTFLLCAAAGTRAQSKSSEPALCVVAVEEPKSRVFGHIFGPLLFRSSRVFPAFSVALSHASVSSLKDHAQVRAFVKRESSISSVRQFLLNFCWLLYLETNSKTTLSSGRLNTDQPFLCASSFSFFEDLRGGGRMSTHFTRTGGGGGAPGAWLEAGPRVTRES